MKLSSPFCFIGLHNWEYKKEKHNVVDHPSGRKFVRVLIRKCKCCGHREHHMLPRANGRFTNWVSWDKIKEDDTIKFTQL
jgi:hypothetical protein